MLGLVQAHDDILALFRLFHRLDDDIRHVDLHKRRLRRAGPRARLKRQDPQRHIQRVPGADHLAQAGAAGVRVEGIGEKMIALVGVGVMRLARRGGCRVQQF